MDFKLQFVYYKLNNLSNLKTNHYSSEFIKYFLFSVHLKSGISGNFNQHIALPSTKHTF